MEQSAVLNILVRDTCINRQKVLEYYQSKAKPAYRGDSGIDLIFPETTLFPLHDTKLVGLGISASMTINGKPVSYLMTPRSSIYKTPLILANSIGLIDAEYRGELKGALRCVEMNDVNYPFKVAEGSSLLQIIAPNLLPIKVNVVDQLDVTERGENGFGSSNLIKI